jgi:hypothetical protein
MVYHYIYVAMKSVKKRTKLRGCRGIDRYNALVIKLEIAFNKRASLRSVNEEEQSFGYLVRASAIGGDIHNAQQLAKSERRADRVSIGTCMVDYQCSLVLSDT